MRFVIERASTRSRSFNADKPPFEGAYIAYVDVQHCLRNTDWVKSKYSEYKAKTFEEVWPLWIQKGTNHKRIQRKVSKLATIVTYTRYESEMAWVIDVNTIDDVLEMGEVIISPQHHRYENEPGIVIYDDYME